MDDYDDRTATDEDAADPTDPEETVGQSMTDPVTGLRGAGPVGPSTGSPGRRKRWPIVAGVLILVIAGLVLWIVLKPGLY